MSQFQAAVRFQGASFREHMAKVYLANGPTFGEEFGRRVMWELADYMAEVHGPTVVQDTLRSALEGIQIDHAPPIEEPGPDLLLQAIEGLTTVAEQTRQTAAAALEESRANIVRIGGIRSDVTALTQRFNHPVGFKAWARYALYRAQWWPLIFALGLVLGHAVAA